MLKNGHKLQISMAYYTSKIYEVNLIHVSDRKFEFVDWQDWINIKDWLKEIVDLLPNTDKYSVDSYMTTTINQSKNNKSNLAEGILIMEIDEKRLKIELEYNFQQAFIKYTKDLNLIYWWLQNTKNSIYDELEKNKEYYVVEYARTEFYYLSDKERFVGIKKDQSRNGFGICYKPNGLISYIGNFKNDMKEGKGIAFDSTGYPIYRGEFLNDKLEGYGLRRFENKREYLGYFKNGQENGKGVLYEECGTILQESEWIGGRPHGFGRSYDEIGLITYEGLFRAGIAIYKDNMKPKKVFWDDKVTLKYFGQLNAKEQNHGYGRKFDKTGKQIYSGGFRYGKEDGVGIEYTYNCIDYFTKKITSRFKQCFEGCNNLFKCLQRPNIHLKKKVKIIKKKNDNKNNSQQPKKRDIVVLNDPVTDLNSIRQKIKPEIKNDESVNESNNLDNLDLSSQNYNPESKFVYEQQGFTPKRKVLKTKRGSIDHSRLSGKFQIDNLDSNKRVSRISSHLKMRNLLLKINIAIGNDKIHKIIDSSNVYSEPSLERSSFDYHRKSKENANYLNETLAEVTHILNDIHEIIEQENKNVGCKIYNEYFGFFCNGFKRKSLEKMDINEVSIKYIRPEYYEDTKIKYNGFWVRNKRDGRGKFFYNDIENVPMYAGEWKRNKIHGYGMIYNKSEECIFEGNFEQGKIINGVVTPDAIQKNNQPIRNSCFISQMSKEDDSYKMYRKKVENLTPPKITESFNTRKLNFRYVYESTNNKLSVLSSHKNLPLSSDEIPEQAHRSFNNLDISNRFNYENDSSKNSPKTIDKHFEMQDNIQNMDRMQFVSMDFTNKSSLSNFDSRGSGQKMSKNNPSFSNREPKTQLNRLYLSGRKYTSPRDDYSQIQNNITNDANSILNDEILYKGKKKQNKIYGYPIGKKLDMKEVQLKAKSENRHSEDYIFSNKKKDSIGSIFKKINPAFITQKIEELNEKSDQSIQDDDEESSNNNLKNYNNRYGNINFIPDSFISDEIVDENLNIRKGYSLFLKTDINTENNISAKEIVHSDTIINKSSNITPRRINEIKKKPQKMIENQINEPVDFIDKSSLSKDNYELIYEPKVNQSIGDQDNCDKRITDSQAPLDLLRNNLNFNKIKRSNTKPDIILEASNSSSLKKSKSPIKMKKTKNLDFQQKEVSMVPSIKSNKSVIVNKKVSISNVESEILIENKFDNTDHLKTKESKTDCSLDIKFLNLGKLEIKNKAKMKLKSISVHKLSKE